MPAIRANVLGALRRPDTHEFLVQRLPLPGEPITARRFIGGGIEFGETSDDALEREFREELGVAVEAGPVVGTVENVYVWAGDPEHEFTVIREARFADRSLYDRETFRGVEDGVASATDGDVHGSDAPVSQPEANASDDGEAVEDGGAFEYEADWQSLADLQDAPEPFFPNGVAGLFADDGGSHLVSADD